MIRDPEKFTLKNQAFDKEQRANHWYYEIHDLGFNYRITDFQCALGISQLTKLDRFVNRRREIAEKYDQVFKNLSELRPLTEGNKNSSYHLYVALIDFEKAFDSISWKYIDKALESFGFGPNYRKWITVLYHKSSSCVTNNGFTSPYFKLGRSVLSFGPLFVCFSSRTIINHH